MEFTIIESFIWAASAYFGLSSLYFLVFAIASLFYREKETKQLSCKLNIAVLLPAYKEDEVIINSVQSAVLHHSAKAELAVYAIADSLKPETLEILKNTSAHVIEVSFEKSTKTKSIRFALQQLPSTTDYVVILDADNIMAKGFIDQLAETLLKGYQVVQGHRTAKNSNTDFAVLDGISEEINNAIFRKGHSALGFSASLIGSGFACEYTLLNSLLENAQAVGGFDKELELMIIEQGKRIAYAHKAVVFDEKVQNSNDFVNQRRRWIYVQFSFLFANLTKAFSQLMLKGNIDYFDKLMQFALPPRIIALGASFIASGLFFLVSLFHPQSVSVPFFIVWATIFIATVAAVAIAAPMRKYRKQLLRAIISIPRGVWFTVLAVLKLRGANRRFIHTKHSISSQNEQMIH